MRLLPSILLGAALLAGCREATPPVPADKPTEEPKAGAPAASANTPAAPTVGSAVVDMITQRDKVEAGKRAKAVIEKSAATEDKNLKEALTE